MKLFNFLSESFQHYTVKHKRTGKTYKVTAMHSSSAIDKAKQQHGGTASRYTGTSSDDFEIVEGKSPHSDFKKRELEYELRDEEPKRDPKKRKPYNPKTIKRKAGASGFAEGEVGELADKLKNAIASHKELIDFYNEKDQEFRQKYGDDAAESGEDTPDGNNIDYATDGINRDDEEDKLEYFQRALSDHQDLGTTHFWQSEFISVDTAVRDEIATELSNMGAWQGDLEDGDGAETGPSMNTMDFNKDGEVVEGRMSDIHQDAQDMSKEEFTKKHPSFADDYDDINAETLDEAGAKDCWDGYKKDGTQPGTGKNKGKRVNNCVKEDEDEVDLGPTWEDDLEAALDGQPEHLHDTIKDGVCPECSGTGYMDGDSEDENGEENLECNGMYNYECDEGEIRDNTWADELKRQEPKQPAPSKEQIMKILPRLHDEFVKTGRFNAFALSDILKQLYPEIGRRDASSYVADFLSNFKETAELRKLAGLDELDETKYKQCKSCAGKGCDHCGGTGKHAIKEANPQMKTNDSDSNDVVVAKMLSKALGDPNRWMEMSPPELYAELESTNPESADLIAKVAKVLYDVKLQERTYKDVGVADVQKDPRGKEFKFDKDAKQFKSQDGELADIKTKTGQDLMKKRKLSMKKSTPSYNKKSTPKKKGLIAKLFQDLEG